MFCGTLLTEFFDTLDAQYGCAKQRNGFVAELQKSQGMKRKLQVVGNVFLLLNLRIPSKFLEIFYQMHRCPALAEASAKDPLTSSDELFHEQLCTSDCI